MDIGYPLKKIKTNISTIASHFFKAYGGTSSRSDLLTTDAYYHQHNWICICVALLYPITLNVQPDSHKPHEILQRQQLHTGNMRPKGASKSPPDSTAQKQGISQSKLKMCYCDIFLAIQSEDVSEPIIFNKA